MAFSPKRRPQGLSPEGKRLRRLDLSAKSAIWWMLVLAFLYLATGNRFSIWFRLRYLMMAAPIMRSLGLAYGLLALYLRRSLSEPENQYLAVDLLTLFFVGQVLVVTNTAVTGEPV